ncbi:MAG: type II toxin-antitoxin system mRNA interferase toxin, RelE/StbE family [Vicingaceae bacterium]|nr:type II toxin-antitoxin system mRNA interferase toxin, RelE/StbE family [Vicingaceae bacterium]
MKLLFEDQFSKDLDKIIDKNTLKKVAKVIDSLEKEPSLTKITNLKKLKGIDAAYRIRLGDYRLCFFYQNQTAIITRILHRKHVYKYFP